MLFRCTISGECIGLEIGILSSIYTVHCMPYGLKKGTTFQYFSMPEPIMHSIPSAYHVAIIYGYIGCECWKLVLQCIAEKLRPWSDLYEERGEITSN